MALSEKVLREILDVLDDIAYIKLEDMPNIDLYMDQVTTFMDRKLRAMSRCPEEDKILTKTMINNYAKNNLLPAPVKKKYSKEHLILLIFIYYYKGILSIGDIQTLLAPITEKFFPKGKDFDLEKLYLEVFEGAHKQKASLKEDICEKYKIANESFQDAPNEETEMLQMFSFICQLSVDVYLKKQIIERLIDQFEHKSVEITSKTTGKRKKTESARYRKEQKNE